MAKIVEVTMDHTKSTKHTERFDARGNYQQLQCVYIDKSAFVGKTLPKSIVVSVEEAV